MSVEIGDPAPDFTATTPDGQTISLAGFKGKQSVVIFFYPSDNSPICTQEACAFRDAYEDFVKIGAAVIAISSDSDETHRDFAAKKKLPYLMISDRGNALRKLFEVPSVVCSARSSDLCYRSGRDRPIQIRIATFRQSTCRRSIKNLATAFEFRRQVIVLSKPVGQRWMENNSQASRGA